MLGLTQEQEELIGHSRSLRTALRILDFARRPEGASVEEFLDHLKIPASTFHPRMYELLHAGCISVVGKRRTRTGHLARVYLASPGVTFAQYLQFKSISRSQRTARSDLNDIERAVLAAGMEALNAWRKGGTRRRRNVVIALVKKLDRIASLQKCQERACTEPSVGR